MLELSEHIRIQLERCSDLPSMPAVAVQILKLAQSDSSTMGQVADAVGYDPALATKLLKIANSPLYGQRRNSSNIRQAVMLLGLNSTLMLTLSFSLFASLREQEKRGLNYNAYWQRALLSSTAARLLAAQIDGVSPEDAFLAALLQDIGMAVMDRAFDEFYLRQDADLTNHRAVIDYEHQQTATNHSAIGAWLLEQWGFPSHLIAAVENSHKALVNPTPTSINTLDDCVALSGVIADGIIAIDRAPRGEAQIDAQRLADEFEPLLNELYEEIPVVEGLFEMNLLDEKYTSKVLNDAKELLLIRGLNSAQEVSKNRKVIELHEQRTQRLTQESMRDHLTGLSNRKHFDQAMEEEFSHAKNNNWPLSTVFVDLDKFKQINDRFGHPVGDDVLKFSAKILDAYTRDRDAVFRYGGEEFVVLLPGCSSSDAEATATRIVEALRSNTYTLPNQEQIRVSCSVGVATLDEQSDFAHRDLLVEAADQAMYAAKRNGGDQVIVSQLAMQLSCQ